LLQRLTTSFMAVYTIPIIEATARVIGYCTILIVLFLLYANGSDLRVDYVYTNF